MSHKPDLQQYLDSQVSLTALSVTQSEVARESKFGTTRSQVLTSRPRGYPTLEDQAARALTRNVLFRVGNQNLHGEHGRDGRHGSGGYGGSYGGGAGGRGEDGQDGTHAQDGRSAGRTLARDVVVCVRGENEHLLVAARGAVTSAHSNMAVNLGPSKVLFIDGCGGCGGWGGHGGHGGDGGNGGSGTHGRNGDNGASAYGYGQRGGDGQNGGPGGPGGRGGDGGDAGDAGRGGHAGSGSRVTMQAVNPQLLMLLEGDARAGIGGTAGKPGRGGDGGYGGAGGPGGSGGYGGAGGPAKYENIAQTGYRTGSDGRSESYTYYVNTCTVSAGASGSNGFSGPSGPSGSPGNRGRNGRPADDGSHGQHGSLTYQIVREDGSVIESNRDRFNVAVLSYRVDDGNDDGIFEPGVDGGGLQLLQVAMQNNGGLTMPDGAWLHSINGHAPSGREVGTIRVGGIAKSSAIFQTNIPDVPCSIGKPHKDTLRVGTRVTLLGHPFDESQVNGVVVVQFPVQVVMATSNTYMGPNESGTIDIQLINLSTRDYGQNAPQSAGAIVIDLVCDPFFELLPDRNPGGLFDYVIGENRHTATATIYNLKAGYNITVRFRVHLLPGAGDVLMMALPWSTTLRLRGKRIEQRDHTVRVVPRFEPNIYCDLCLITSPNMDREEFLAWSYLMQCLELSLSLWDVERYKGIGGIGRGPPSSNGLRVGWVDRCQVMLAPRLSNAQGSPEINTVSINDSTGQLGTSGGGHFEGHVPIEVPTAESLGSLNVQQLLAFIDAHGAPTNGCVDLADLQAIARDLVPDQKAADFIQNRTGDAFRARHAALADVQSMIVRRQSARHAIARRNRGCCFWKKPDFVRLENDISLELGMPKGVDGDRGNMPAEGNGWGSMCMLGWSREELWHLVFNTNYPLTILPWGGVHLFPSCLSKRAFAFHADREATQAIRRGEKSNPARRFSALGSFAPQKTGCYRASYGVHDLAVYESSHPRDAPFFCQSAPFKITSGSVPYTTSTGADRKVAYHVSSYAMNIHSPFARTLVSVVLCLKPHQLLRYLRKPSHLVQYTFVYEPKLGCGRNCCRMLTCGDKPMEEVDLSIADIVVACMADNLRREFDCFAHQGPIACPFAEEIAAAVEAQEGTKGAAEWAALAAINAELDRTFWRGFPGCCTRVSKRRAILRNARDRIITQLNPLDRKPLKMNEIWAVPKLREFLQDDKESGFPSFNGPDYDFSVRSTSDQSKECCDFMCCSGIYAYWPWSTMISSVITLFAAVGVPLLVFLLIPQVVQDLDEMPNSLYFALCILPACILVLIFLPLFLYHYYQSVRTARRWKRFRRLQAATYLPYITNLRTAHTQAPQREHRQEVGQKFHENYVPKAENEPA